MDITTSDFEEIETLASQSYTAKAIAMALNVNPSLFVMYCSDDTHPIGVAYLKGCLEINRKKNEKLLGKVNEGSEVAIQLHDKKAKDQAFLDIKNDIFSAFDE
ncbi:hypothetical protein [Tenacibaculum soleae]|uniref:hypothetical protein n=1 Tax=Tenacibaculum soleae TaxID=447689 RepID=UPI0023002106|nr:hypothetical protein [Tenacibaculum soleae]